MYWNWNIKNKYVVVDPNFVFNLTVESWTLLGIFCFVIIIIHYVHVRWAATLVIYLIQFHLCIYGIICFCFISFLYCCLWLLLLLLCSPHINSRGGKTVKRLFINVHIWVCVCVYVFFSSLNFDSKTFVDNRRRRRSQPIFFMEMFSCLFFVINFLMGFWGVGWLILDYITLYYVIAQLQQLLLFLHTFSRNICLRKVKWKVSQGLFKK